MSAPVVVATLGDAASVAWTASAGTFTNAAATSPTYEFPTMDESVTNPITITATFSGVSFTSQSYETTNNDDATLGLVGTIVETSDSGIATAEIESGQIKITSVGVGTVTITVKDGSKTATISVTVNTEGDITVGTIVKYKSNDATLSGLTVSEGTLTPSFASGTTSYAVNVDNAISDITVTPTVTDTDKATVAVNDVAVTSGTESGDIPLTAGAATTITIVVTAEDSSTKNYTIAVTRAAAPISVTGVTLNKPNASIPIDGNETLTATVSPTNAANKTVTWSSSDPSVATVFDGTVTAPVTGVTINKFSTYVLTGGNETLTATIAPSDATNKSVIWSSDDESVATVSATGVVTGVSSGTTTITVATDDGGFTATCVVNVIDDNKVTIEQPAPNAPAAIAVNGRSKGNHFSCFADKC